MAVTIRLKRIGTTKKPHWRFVVADTKSPRDGRFIEELGFYHPRKEPAEINVNTERTNYWISQGAKPSVSVKNLLKKVGIQ